MALGSISNAYLNGRPSGLPDDIVEQLVQVKQQQVLQPIQDDIDETKSRKDTYTSLNSKLVDLFKAAETLNDTDSFSPSTIVSSNETVATVTAGSNALVGSYALDVSQRAKAHTHVIGVDNGGADVTRGIGAADDSTLLNDNVTLSFFHEGTEYSYSTTSETTLASLANQITNDDNGVTAQALNVGSSEDPQYVLSFKSQATGGGSHRITTDEAGSSTGVTIDTSGSSGGSLFVDDSGIDLTSEQMTTFEGQNAQFTMDGISFTRTTNEVTDVIDNVTINLLDAGTADINVSRDLEKVTETVQGFVDAFNSFDAFLDEKTAYNEASQEGGPLTGDSLARSARSRLNAILSEPLTGGDLEYLFQVGIEKEKDGSLSFDTEKFQDAFQENPQDVQNLVVGDDTVTGKVDAFLKEFTNEYGGIIPSKIDSISEQIDDLDDDYYDAQVDLQEYRERMTEKYTRLEQMVLQYQSVGDNLTSMIDTWDTNSSSSK